MTPPAPVVPKAPSPPSPPVAAPAPKVQAPSSDADYLNNPPLTYPAMSRRLGEQGKVIVSVLVGADGLPKKAEIRRSSGYPRLDDAARQYILRSRFVPGKINGVPEAMSYDAPVNFTLGN